MSSLLWQQGSSGAAESAQGSSGLVPLGLMSRAELTAELERRLFAASEERRPFALLWLTVVPQGGEANGCRQPSSSMLRHCAERIAARLADRDVMAYLGDGDFAVLVGSLREPTDAIAFARNVLDAFQRPFLEGASPLYAEINLGVAVHPTDGDLPVRLLRAAQGAAHRAAAELPGRRARLAFCSETLHKRQARNEQIRAGLATALAQEELELHYQPMLYLPDDRVAAVEALIRWNSNELGRVTPDEFIPTAERSGEIVPIGKWVIAEACRRARAWELEGMPVRVAVNLSARQLQEPDLTDYVSGMLETTGLSAELLELELTESMYAEPETAIAVLKRLHEIGVRVAIDDFGTGYSSLSYLARFPRDTLKIDRSFISQTTHDNDVAAVVGSVIVMAHALGVQTVAEGVETDDHLSFLVAHGCDLSQGYLHSPPLPEREIEGWLRSHNGGAPLASQAPAETAPSAEAVARAARELPRYMQLLSNGNGNGHGAAANGNGNGNGAAHANGNGGLSHANGHGTAHVNGNGGLSHASGNGALGADAAVLLGGNGNGHPGTSPQLSSDANGVAHPNGDGKPPAKGGRSGRRRAQPA